MANEKNSFKLFVYGVLILVLFLAFIKLFVNGSGLFFTLELLGFLGLGFLALLGFIAYKDGWGENLFFTVFLGYLINLVLIWAFNGTLYATLGLLSVIGFLLAFPRKHEPKPVRKREEPHSMVFDPVVPKATAKHSPGKYVASSKSNIYHAPKCEWAKKIKKDRQTWFAEKEDAWGAGYKAHQCVE